VRIPQTPLWLLLLETGARWGELTASTWNDFDATNRTLTLRAETTKSKKTRTIPLRDSAVDALRLLQRVHAAHRGRLPRISDPIFLTPSGVSWRRSRENAARAFHRLLKRAGISRVNESRERVSIHSLRHTAATRLARAGVDLVRTQLILGHSDPKLTAEVYTHLATEDLRTAIESVPELGSQPLHGRKPPLPREEGLYVGTQESAQPLVNGEVAGGGPSRTRTWDLAIMSGSL